MKRKPPRRTRFAVVGLLLLAAAPVLADGILDEIVAMLESGLSEPTILDWLEAGDRAPELPSAAQLIELKRAGASEEMLRELLRRSRPPAAAPPPPAATAAPAPASPKAGSGAEVRFRLLYAPRFDEGEDEWDLLVYLDGRPLSYVPVSSELLGLAASEPVELATRLPAGRHTLRVMQERHQRRRRGWRHAARAAEAAFDFDLAAGEPAGVELEFRQGWGDLSDPLTFRFSQGDRVADRVEVGGEPGRWPDLCEDAGGKPPAGCVGWGSLWPGLEPASRAEVREALARFEFRPIPR